MTIARKVALACLAAPSIILGCIVSLLLSIIFFSVPTGWDKENMAVTNVWRPWVRKHWKWNTTLASAIFYQSEMPSAHTIAHEKVHVRQYQDEVVQGLLWGILFALFRLDPWMLILWPLGVLSQSTNFLTAFLRGKNFYRGSEHEESAYAQTDHLRTTVANKNEDRLSATPPEPSNSEEE